MMKIYLISGCFIFLSNSLGAQIRKVADIEPEGSFKSALNLKDPRNIVIQLPGSKVTLSEDAGTTWKTSSINAPSSSLPVDLVPDIKGNFYLFTISGNKRDSLAMFESSDNGNSWSEATIMANLDNKSRSNYHVTVDHKSNMTLTFTQYDKYGDVDPNCHSNIFLAESKSGKRWSEPFQLSQTPGGCVAESSLKYSSSAYDLDGRGFVSWLNQGRIFLDRSFNGGSMWLTNDIAVLDINVNKDNNGSTPDLNFAVDNSKGLCRGCMFMSWTEQRKGALSQTVWFLRSTNHGDNWTSAVKVNDNKQSKNQFKPSMTIDQSNGNIHIMYMNEVEEGKVHIFLAYSTNSGQTFTNIKITEEAFVYDETLTTSVKAHKGSVVLAWSQKADSNKTEVWSAVMKQADLENIKSVELK